MNSGLVIVGIAMLIGLGAVVYMALYLIWAVLSSALRAVGQAFGLKDRPTRGTSAEFATSGRGALVCPNADCRRVEHRDARYCPQCGARLS